MLPAATFGAGFSPCFVVRTQWGQALGPGGGAAMYQHNDEHLEGQPLVMPARLGGGGCLVMPHTCPSEGKGEQPRARAVGVMGTALQALAALARESSPCLHMAGGPEKIGQELPPFTSPHPCVLPQH